MVTLAKRSMSDTELRHRKKLQAVASRATATTGLTSLALLGASGVAGRRGAHGVAHRLRNASLNTGIVGSGISGVAGFNFARIQSEEAKKHPRPVATGPLVKRDRGTPVISQISAARAVRTANRLEDPARAKRLAAHLAKVPTSAKSPMGQRVVYWKAVAGNRDVRLVRPTADRWSRTFKGVTAIKNADPRGPQDVHQILHHPLKARDTADNRIVRSLARNAPKSDRPLHRVTFVRVGTKEPVGHRTPSSWTPDEKVARDVARYQQTRNRRNAAMARKTKLVPKVSQTFQRRVLPGELHLVTKPEGMRAMNLSAATPRFRQSERVAVTHVRAQHATPLSKKKDQGWVLKPRKQFDSEASRDRREKAYGKGLAAASGVLAGGAVYQGARAGQRLYGAASATATAGGHRRIAGERDAVQARALSEAKELRRPGTRLGPKQAAGFEHLAHEAGKDAFKHRQTAMKLIDGRGATLRSAARHGGKAAALGVGALALAGGAKAVTQHRQHGGRTYNGWWEHRY